MEQELSRILAARKVHPQYSKFPEQVFPRAGPSEAQVEYVRRDVDDNILWDTLSINLPQLLSQLERILSRQE